MKTIILANWGRKQRRRPHRTSLLTKLDEEERDDRWRCPAERVAIDQRPDQQQESGAARRNPEIASGDFGPLIGQFAQI